jgi:hypothetical protein
MIPQPFSSMSKFIKLHIGSDVANTSLQTTAFVVDRRLIRSHSPISSFLNLVLATTLSRRAIGRHHFHYRLTTL